MDNQQQSLGRGPERVRLRDVFVQPRLTPARIETLPSGKKVVVGEGDLFDPKIGHIPKASLLKLIERSCGRANLLTDLVCQEAKRTGFSAERITSALEALFPEE